MTSTNPLTTNTMKKQNYDITLGEDKFLPVPDQQQKDHKLLRLHIDDATRKRSYDMPPHDRRARDSIVASLAIALVILAATAVIVHCAS